MKYAERFLDIAVTQLQTNGFEQLSQQQKMLAYHLSRAGLWGRYISLDQGSEFNIAMFRALLEMKSRLSQIETSGDLFSTVEKQVHDSLYILFAHNGVYHGTTGEKVQIPLRAEDLDELKKAYPSMDVVIAKIGQIWFSDAIKPWRTVQTDGVDVVASSGSNFYKNLTTDEVKKWRAENYPSHPSNDVEVPPYGFNERLIKLDTGVIQREVVFKNGLYGPYIKKIIECLQKAMAYAENERQRKSIETLISFYETGTAKSFDEHCVAWTSDQDSDIYYINGLIESYDDPLGIGCGFESIVAFKNPIQTAKVNKIIDHIQWFENSMPFADAYKKEKAQGLSASSVTVISMAGETSPSLPLGINLPNSDWIRGKHGSKSVNLANSASSRSAFEQELNQALYLPKYHPLMDRYLNLTNGLHTDLHEIAGHGSGQVLPGVNTDVLGAFYAVIEECRADLVALYFMPDEALKAYGIFDEEVVVHDAALCQYVAYLSNGVFAQLRRIKEGQDLTQAHFRNRQLISTWILEHAEKSCVELVTVDGKVFIEVHDVERLKFHFGQLLAIIQDVKSTGNYEGARDLVMGYGTKVNQEHLRQTHARIESLNMPKTICFVTPVIQVEGDEVSLQQVDDFMKQQIQLFEAHCGLVD